MNDTNLDCEERIDTVNDNIELIQKKDGLTFGTDALLLAGYIDSGGGRALEIGGGTGIISLLTLSRGKFDTVDVLEVQEDFAELSERNARRNSLSDKMRVICADVREFEAHKQYDAVFTNPPYMKTNTGKANAVSRKNVARHEVNGDIEDFLKAAKRLLKYGGKFYAVYRPDRLTDLIFAMRSVGIEPKRMTVVHADAMHEPSMVLIEGRLGGGAALKLTRPLIIHSNSRKESDDMAYIIENGCFPDDFYIKNRGRKNGSNRKE